MKKTFIIVLSLLLCLCFASCRGKDVYLSDDSAPAYTSSAVEQAVDISSNTPSSGSVIEQDTSVDSSDGQLSSDGSTQYTQSVSSVLTETAVLSKTDTNVQSSSSVSISSAASSSDEQAPSVNTPTETSSKTPSGEEETDPTPEESSSSKVVSLNTVGNIVPIK